MKPKPTRGGSRPGAGRKPRDTPREAITVRLEPQDAAKLRDLCAAREMSQAAWIAEKIRKSRIPHVGSISEVRPESPQNK